MAFWSMGEGDRGYNLELYSKKCSPTSNAVVSSLIEPGSSQLRDEGRQVPLAKPYSTFGKVTLKYALQAHLSQTQERELALWA